MNIYSIQGFYYDEKEMDDIYTFIYLTHEKIFTKEQFNNMCQEGLETILDKNAYELETFLKLNYGFKNIKPIENFEFEED